MAFSLISCFINLIIQSATNKGFIAKSNIMCEIDKRALSMPVFIIRFVFNKLVKQQMNNNDDILSKSENSLRSKIEANPDDIAPKLEYAYFLSGRQRYDEAEAYFEEAYNIARNNPDVVSMYSRFLLMRGKSDDAEALVAEALKNNPMEAALLRAHGNVLFSMNEFEAAIDEFNTARSLIGDDPSIDYQIVECLIAGGYFEEAVEQAKSFSEQYPDCATRLHSLGRSYWAAEMLEQAETVLKRAQNIEDRSLNILLDLCGVLNDMEEYELAVSTMLENEPKFESSAEFFYVLGNLLSDADNNDRARAAYMKALAINPRHFHALNNLALLLQEKKAPESEVEDLFKRALDANPDDTLANYNYGNFLIGTGKREEAIPHYRKVLDNDPWYLQARISYAQTLLELGDKARALEELRDVTMSEDAMPEDLARVARLYIQVDREEEGERLLLRAVKESEGNAFFPLEYLGDYYYERGRPADAIKSYIRATLIDPGDSAIWVKAVGVMLDYRTRKGFIESVEKFLLEELPVINPKAREDELVSVFLMLTEDLSNGAVKSLSTFGDAAWKLRQPALLGVYAGMMAEFGQYDEAERAYSAALTESPADVALAREFIGMLLERKDYDTAKKVILDTSAHLPDEPMLENDLGLVEFTLGNSREAESLFYSLSRRYPLEPTYIYNYAWVLYNRGMRDIAVTVLEKYLETVSFDEESAYFAAQMIAESRDKTAFTRAKQYLGKVISLNPEHHSAWTLLGWIQEESGDLKGAQFSFGQALSIAPENMKTLLSAAGFALSTLQFEQAESYLDRAAKVDPNNEDLLFERARYLQATNRFVESLEPLEHLYSKMSDVYAFPYACTLRTIGRIENADAIAQKHMDSPTTRANSVSKSWYQFLVNDIEGAIDTTMEGMREWAEIVDFRNLSAFLLAGGRIDESYEALEIFLQNVVQPLDVHFYLCDLRDYKDRFPEETRNDYTVLLTHKLDSMLTMIAPNGNA